MFESLLNVDGSLGTEATSLQHYLIFDMFYHVVGANMPLSVASLSVFLDVFAVVQLLIYKHFYKCVHFNRI